jgi:hypothetical protein
VDPTDSEVELARSEIRDSREFLHALRANLQEHTPRPVRQKLFLYGGLGALGMLVPVLALKAVVGTVSGVMLARSAHNHKSVVKGCLHNLDAFQSRLDREGA